MSKSTYPLKLPPSTGFLREQAGDARPEDLLRYVRAAPKVPPVPRDEPPHDNPAHVDFKINNS